MACICGNPIEPVLSSLGSVACRRCRENPARHQTAIELVRTVPRCPSAGCPERLVLDDETDVLRCPSHGPMQIVA